MSYLLQKLFLHRLPQNLYDADSLTSLLHSDMASTDSSNVTPSRTQSPITNGMGGQQEDYGTTRPSSGFRRPFHKMSGLFKKTIGRSSSGSGSDAHNKPSAVGLASPASQGSTPPVRQQVSLDPRATPDNPSLDSALAQVSVETTLLGSANTSSSPDQTEPVASSPTSAEATQGQRVGRFKRFVTRKLQAMGLKRSTPAGDQADPAYEAYRLRWDAEFSAKIDALRESAANSARSHSEAVAANEQLAGKVASLQNALCWEQALQAQDPDDRDFSFPPVNYAGSTSEWRRSNTVARFHAHRRERNSLAAKLADARKALAAQQSGTERPAKSHEDMQSRLDALQQRCDAAELDAERLEQELFDAKVELSGAEAEKKAQQAGLRIAIGTATEFEELNTALKQSTADSMEAAARKTEQYNDAMKRLNHASADIERAHSACAENESLRTAVSVLFRQMERVTGVADPTATEEVAAWARALPPFEPAAGEEMVPLSSYRAAIRSFTPICDLAAELRDELAAQLVRTLGPNEMAVATERVLGPAAVHRALQIARYAARSFRDGQRAEFERAESYRRLLEEHGLA